MTTLTDTDEPDIWANEFCRLFKLPAEDVEQVSHWFQSAMETAIRLDQERRNDSMVPAKSDEVSESDEREGLVIHDPVELKNPRNT
jgi:hexokinase